MRSARIGAAIAKDARGIARRSLGEVGGLAQLARAPALQAGGHRFESDILHKRKVRGKEGRSSSLPALTDADYQDHRRAVLLR